jgi:hypothetical protein
LTSVLPLTVRSPFEEHNSRICWSLNLSFNSGLHCRHFSNIFSISCPPFVAVAGFDCPCLVLDTGDAGQIKKPQVHIFPAAFDAIMQCEKRKKPQVLATHGSSEDRIFRSTLA